MLPDAFGQQAKPSRQQNTLHQSSLIREPQIKAVNNFLLMLSYPIRTPF
jgi:hypothetical protein